MRVRIDSGGRTYLPICECGWRGLPSMSHAQALEEARAHELRAHPGDKQALRALVAARARHAD